MRLGAQQCDKRCIVEPQRALPETVQFHHLPEYGDERTEGVGQSPRKLTDRRRWLAHNALNGVSHLDTRLAPVAGEVEYIEAVKLRLPLEQLRDGGGDVGQIGSGVADIRLAWYKIERTGLPGLIKPCANQLLPVRAPKKSPARTMSVRTPSQLAASSRFRRRSTSTMRPKCLYCRRIESGVWP